jgi:nitrite reductase (NAD(P)H)
VKLRETDVKTPKEQWQWKKMCNVADLMPTDAGTTSAAVKYGDTQIAIYHVPKRGYFASQQVSVITCSSNNFSCLAADVPTQARLRP